MTKAVGAVVAELLSVAEDILQNCPPGQDQSVTVGKHLRQRLQDGYDGVMELIHAHRRSAEKKLGLNDTWLRVVANRNHQLRLLDSKGNPLETPENRVVNESKEVVDEATKAGLICSTCKAQFFAPSGVPTDSSLDKCEACLAQTCEVKTPQPEVDWSVNPGKVPEHIELGLVRAIGQGLTQAKAVALVATNTGQPKDAVMGHLEKLIEHGKILRKGKSVTLPEAPPVDLVAALSDAIRKAPSGTFANNIILSVATQTKLPTHEVAAQWDALVLEGRIEESGGFWNYYENPLAKQSDAAPIEAGILVEKLFAAVRVNRCPNNKQKVIDQLANETTIPANQIEVVFEELAFANRLTQNSEGQWIVHCPAEDLIREKMESGLFAGKSVLLESVAMQLEWPLAKVEDVWSMLCFSGQIVKKPLVGFVWVHPAEETAESA